MITRARLLAASGAALAVRPFVAYAQDAPLRVGNVPTDGFAEAYYAQDAGFFAKAGLNVEMFTFNNGQGSVTAIAGNAIDVGVSSVNAIANAVIHGIPMAYFGAGNLFLASNPTLALCVARDATFTSAKDFEGQTIAVAGIKDGTHVGAGAYLLRNGVDISKVKFIEMPFPQMAPALERGTIAAATLAEPFLTAGAARVKPFSNAFASLGDRYMLGGWFASREFLTKNRSTAAKFMGAIYETAKWANANHEKSGEILTKYAKLDPALIAKMSRVTYAESITPEIVEPTLTWSWNLKYIDKPIAARELIVKV